MKKPSILIIDDEPDNFDVIEAFLSNQDYQLHYTSSGEEAIAYLDTLQPDVILLDVMMPGLDGLEVCQRIKAMEKWQAVPIIMVTSLNSKEDLAHCLQTGADDFISKPINSAELRARLQSMLRIKQQHDRLQAFVELQGNTTKLLNRSLQELRGNLASTFPHELNTPLRGILANLNILIVDLEDMGVEETREILNRSYQSVRRLEKQIQRSLNYLSLELAMTQPVQQAKSGSNLITLLAQAQAKQTSRSDDLVCQVEKAELAVSSVHLQWILDELIENAFKFSQPGMPVSVRGHPNGVLFHLRIRNHGHGMTNEQIKKISAVRPIDGLSYEPQGLGLTIAKKTVALYGGRFLISSVYQQETTVQITLPLAGT